MNRNKNECPVCQGDNGCMSGTTNEANCWCVTKEFPKQIFDKVPSEFLNKKCVCINCLQQV